MRTVYLSASTQSGNIGTDGVSEKTRMRELQSKVNWYIQQGRGDIAVYMNTEGMSLGQSIADSNSKNPDIHVAMHSNASGGEGTEVYYSNYPILSEESKKLATILYNNIASVLSGNDRGVKPDTNLYSTGLAETRDTTAKACLIEYFFHDNYNDVVDYLNKVELVAINTARAIYEYFGIEYYVEPVVITPDPLEPTEKEKAVKYIDELKAWDLICRMFNL